MDRKIESITDLIGHVRTMRDLVGKALWFRGQSNDTWKLLPSLIRQDSKLSEASLVVRFKQSAAMLLTERPQGDFDWIFLMQHYGVPTRLLDWTENPLVALYFAIEERRADTDLVDAAFWILVPSELNKNANIVSKDEVDYIPSFDADEVSGYSTRQLENRKLELLPVAAIATRNNSRIQAQLGTFTIHHNKKIPLEEVGDGRHCFKYSIPKNAISELRNELEILGINRFTLFPEMASIGKLIKGMV